MLTNKQWAVIVISAAALATGLASLTQAEEPAQKGPATLFVENCSACHRPDGIGVPPIFPALVGSTLVKGDPAALLLVVLAGRNGMPSFRNDLNDGQLADIISYVRSSWGNDGAPVSAEFIRDLRIATGNEKGENPAMAN